MVQLYGYSKLPMQATEQLERSSPSPGFAIRDSDIVTPQAQPKHALHRQQVTQVTKDTAYNNLQLQNAPQL